MRQRNRYDRELENLRRGRRRKWVGRSHKIEIVPCEVCGIQDLSVIEIHHVLPLASVRGNGSSTEVSEVLCLCANCHKKVHAAFGGTRNVPYTGPHTKAELLDRMHVLRPGGLHLGKKKTGRRSRESIAAAVRDYGLGLGSLRRIASKYRISHSFLHMEFRNSLKMLGGPMC